MLYKNKSLSLKDSTLPVGKSDVGEIYHFTEDELNRLTQEFEKWSEQKRTQIRGKYFLVFLFLRYTGARISEVLSIDEKRDFDYKNSTVRLLNLKRAKKKKQYRIVPIPDKLISEYLRFVKLYPHQEGRVFQLKRNNFFVIFRDLCIKAGIPREIAHPHTLRHTRAIELLRAGIPVTAVQQMLGHASLNTTAVYLKYSNIEIQAMLKMKGLI